jgi:hypothetical protein
VVELSYTCKYRQAIKEYKTQIAIMHCHICNKTGGDDVNNMCFLCDAALCSLCAMRFQTQQKCAVCKQWWFVVASDDVDSE